MCTSSVLKRKGVHQVLITILVFTKCCNSTTMVEEGLLYNHWYTRNGCTTRLVSMIQAQKINV